MDSTRRALIASVPILALAPELLLNRLAGASPIDPSETAVTLPSEIVFKPWGTAPAYASEQAMLYGDYNQPGPYLILMRWHPGYFSAPHTYAADRIQVVVSGVWHVNSGADFTPEQTVPVPAGGFVLRRARTPHYDGVPRSEPQAAVIAVFGEGPVKQEQIDPNSPTWRKV